MIHESRLDDFRVLATDPAYTELLVLALEGRLEVAPFLTHSSRSADSVLHKLIWNGRTLLVKHVRQHWRFETWWFRLIRKNYAFNLIRVADAARTAGQPFTCPVHLVAQRRRPGGHGWDIYTIMDFIEGPTLMERMPVDEETIREVRRLMDLTHANGLAADPHPGNFILSPDGIVQIDVNGRVDSFLRRGRDHLLFETSFGVPHPNPGLNYHIAKKLRAFRQWRRSRSRRP